MNVFNHESLKLQFKLDNEFELVFVVNFFYLNTSLCVSVCLCVYVCCICLLSISLSLSLSVSPCIVFLFVSLHVYCLFSLASQTPPLFAIGRHGGSLVNQVDFSV